MKFVKHIGAICLIALCSSGYTHAQECIDSPPLNNGWGWNGIESCRTASTDQALTMCSIVPVDGNAACLDRYGNDLLTPDLLECEDTDGDGWGWNNQIGSCRVPSANLISNGTFNNGSVGWNTYLHPDSVAVPPHVIAYGDDTPTVSRFYFQDGYVSFGYHRAGTQWWHSQLYTDAISLEGGRTYKLSFYASSSSRTGRATGSVVVENGSDYTKYLTRQDFDIYIGGTIYQAEFFVPASDTNARVTFNLGDNFGGNNSSNIGAIAIDDVRLAIVDNTPDPNITDSDCDYAQADSHGGWGWNSVANESCPPQSDELQPVTGTSCDYSAAASNGGWGWNATTMTSCAPAAN